MLVPRQAELVTTEMLDAFASLTLGIRHADTCQELLLYKERLHKAKMEVLGLITSAEGEALRRLRQITEEDFEQAMGELHNVRGRAEAKEQERT